VTEAARKIVTYVGQHDVISNRDKEIIKKYNVDINVYPDIKDLFSLISNPNFSTDLVIMDIELFYASNDVNFFDIIQTLSTLIAFNKKLDTTVIKRNTNLAVSCSAQTNPSIIKDILSSNLGVYPRGDDFVYDEKEKAAIALLNGEHHIPIKIRDLAKNKKKTVPDNPNVIRLTPRQQQVLNLISTRGASNKAIARILKISESTVKLHITAILKKYSLRNRTQLALFCQKEDDKHKTKKD